MWILIKPFQYAFKLDYGVKYYQYSYHLQDGDVSFPPKILSYFFTECREHIVCVHYCVHKAVQHWREESCMNGGITKINYMV